MMPSAMKSGDSPRSVHRFLRFEDDAQAKNDTLNAKKVVSPPKEKEEPNNSNPQSPPTKYDDQLPLGSSFASPVKRNFVIRKSYSRTHSAPSEGRYMDQLPLGCPPQYSGARPKPKKILPDGSTSPSPSPSSVSARYTDQLALSIRGTSPLQENWNLVHQKPNRVPSVNSAAAVLPAPPLVQATTNATTNSPEHSVTKLIRNFENATTRMSRTSCALRIQMTFRRYRARQHLAAARTSYVTHTVPRLYAVVKIQTTVRAWVTRMKFRLASLEKDLEVCHASKEYALARVERKKQDEMKDFAQAAHYKAGEKLRQAVSQVMATQAKIKEFRQANKKFRTQNQTLTEASAILSQKCTEAQAKHQAQLQEIAALEAEIEKLQREEKRLTASAAVYPKFVRQFSETLEQVNEHAEVEHKSKMAFKTTIAKIMDLVKENCTNDEELVHEIMHMGTSTFLQDTKEPRDFENDVVAVKTDGAAKQPGKKWQFNDISETETSETSYSENEEEEEEEEEHPELVLAKMLQDGAVVDNFETSIQLKAE